MRKNPEEDGKGEDGSKGNLIRKKNRRHQRQGLV